jgi:hypothetical protein
MGSFVAMQRNLERHPPKVVAKKQVTGGLLIVIFAMLEAFVGNHGSISEAVKTLHRLSNYGKPWNMDVWRYQAYRFFETIHTIGNIRRITLVRLSTALFYQPPGGSR